MIQHFFDYECNAWYPNVNTKLKTRLQAAQNKCVRFCLKLNDRCSIKSKDSEKINWFPFHEKVSYFSLCSVYNVFSKSYPKYFDQIFAPKETSVHQRSSYQKLYVPRQKKKKKCWEKSLNLCCSLPFEQLKEDIRSLN